jgi:uncharacterized protein YdeI (YjbR/CyaY-like superfamily)
MAAGDDLPRVEISSRAEWRKWLAEHHAKSGSIWLITWKKRHGRRHVPYDHIVEEALCFGWVDSLPRKLDANRSMLLLSPRKPRSAWSRINKERVERLIAGKMMTPAGLEVIEAAKASGTWKALEEVEDLVIPDDLAKVFQGYAQAAANFAAFPRSVKRGILEWIAQAKRSETRSKRVSETAARAAENIRANQWRQ